ncbi:MAG: bifunctional [glutamine synthetase] adenylyltransferase/[glutamine synthetase]-adenylyl-L-tyrosine phosphorylase [Microbacteriaceae bacterium]
MRRDQTSLTSLAGAGFSALSRVREQLTEFAALAAPQEVAQLLPQFATAADPDAALSSLIALLRQDPDPVRPLLAEPDTAGRLVRLLGASDGLAEFFLRNPAELSVLDQPVQALPDATVMFEELAQAVGAHDGVAALTEETGWCALRVRYRRLLVEIASFDLEQPDPVAAVDGVAAALADLAAAALEASLSVARGQVSGSGPGRFPAEEVAATRLAVIGMGKAGARELNYVSDVDVVFVAGAAEGVLSPGRAIDVATRLASTMMRGIDAPAREPALWEVDANLRPEGKSGVLVRSLDSHLAYYDRWAKTWEFQAQLKARPLAGDLPLGHAYVAAMAPKVWASSGRENFVESVQKMRERVTENIPDDEVQFQLKLGPGGLRDIEFTVQLLQLVHGASDDTVREQGTLPALAALARGGYIGRVEAAEFATDYRMLRLLEHRLQLRQLRRTHLMPSDEGDLRVLARATGLAASATELVQRWSEVKHRVRGLHERLFYRPLLSAVAALPADGLGLTTEQAQARLAAIGFRDPRGALVHIAALSAGVSRRAAIQRTLLPVLLEWFAAGADPDYGLLTFRRLSEDLGTSHWFLRMLRDSSGAAQHLTRILSGSRFAGELLGRIPEAARWLENEAGLRPRPLPVLREETAAILARHEGADAVAAALRAARKREMLRLAFASILGLNTVQELAAGLSDVNEALLTGLLTGIRRGGDPETAHDDGIEFAVIGMGRFGGRELGFGSDADVMYVFRAGRLTGDAAHTAARRIVSELTRLSQDPQLPLDLDIGLRPEGKNGPTVRSLDSYAAYYRRWSLTWEAQALLRARGIAGDQNLVADFLELADEIRYPEDFADQDAREVKRIKARVENERLPQGADPNRHLKLGRGSLSDVEWLVQLEQLRHAAKMPGLRTASTLGALDAAEDGGLISTGDAAKLRDAWLLASRARSAMTLWSNKTADVLPAGRQQLEGVARLMGYPPNSASALEEDYLARTRRSRAVFERCFYGLRDRPRPSAG